MTRQGQLVRWESARGFGFIRSPDIASDVFVHLRDFTDRSVVPCVGMTLRFEEIHVGGKGPRAVAVQALGPALDPPTGLRRSTRTPVRPREPAAEASSAWPFAVLLIAYAAVVIHGVSANRIPPATPFVLLLVGLLTFFAYGTDKHAAETGHWRMSERSLHLLALIGGWPGAWCAQRMFRHKLRKSNFMTVYWATALAHIAAVAAWGSGRLPAGLMAF